MRLPWQRDHIRHCNICGEEWRVSRGLAKRYRPSKWGRGIAPADLFGMRGAQFAASIRYQLDAAEAKGSKAEDLMALTDRLRQCPKCGSDDYGERKADRRVT